MKPATLIKFYNFDLDTKIKKRLIFVKNKTWYIGLGPYIFIGENKYGKVWYNVNTKNIVVLTNESVSS